MRRAQKMSTCCVKSMCYHSPPSLLPSLLSSLLPCLPPPLPHQFIRIFVHFVPKKIADGARGNAAPVLLDEDLAV